MYNLVRKDNKTKYYFLSQESYHIIKQLGDGGSLILSPNNPPLGYVSIINSSHIFPHNRLCAKPIFLENNTTFTSTCKALFKGKIIQDWNLSLWIQINKQAITRYIYIRGQFYLRSDCLLRLLNSNVTIYEDDTLVHQSNGTKEHFAIPDYIPLGNGGYGVCVNTDKEKMLVPH